jgi:hypothetical protein
MRAWVPGYGTSAYRSVPLMPSLDASNLPDVGERPPFRLARHAGSTGHVLGRVQRGRRARAFRPVRGQCVNDRSASHARDLDDRTCPNERSGCAREPLGDVLGSRPMAHHPIAGGLTRRCSPEALHAVVDRVQLNCCGAPRLAARPSHTHQACLPILASEPSLKKPAVGPIGPRVARCTAIAAPCSTVR